MKRFENHASDLAALAAAELWNFLPSIMRLDAVEGFERLEGYFLKTLLAFKKALKSRIPEPSRN